MIALEQPVIVNPEAFVRERKKQFRNVTGKQLVQYQANSTVDTRIVICDACLLGLHACQERSCPCVCKEVKSR